jgi:hypothetical protein
MAFFICGCGSMAEYVLPKDETGVRFPSPAPIGNLIRMFKEGSTNLPLLIPEFDRVKLGNFLTEYRFQNSLNTIIARTRTSGLEHALVVLANAKTGHLSICESKDIGQEFVRRKFGEYIDNGLRPLIAIHTHTIIDSGIDIKRGAESYRGTYFLPSPADMETPHIFDENGIQMINLVESMIVPTSIPRVWIWQTASQPIQKYASKTVDNYFKTISRDITESDINDLIVELKSIGLNLYVGRLDLKNPARSFTEIYRTLDMHTGYVY